jgi:hypothetical protein
LINKSQVMTQQQEHVRFEQEPMLSVEGERINGTGKLQESLWACLLVGIKLAPCNETDQIDSFLNWSVIFYHFNKFLCTYQKEL